MLYSLEVGAVGSLTPSTSKNLMFSKKLIAAGFACISLFSIASASPIVTNGDFETGDLTGWSLVYGSGSATTPGLSGAYKATLQNATAIRSGVLPTITGQTYRFSMDVDSTAPAEFFMSLVSTAPGGLFHDFHWNTSPVYTGAFNAGGAQTYSFDYVAQSSDVIFISFNSKDGSAGSIDNVSVEAVPEPVSMLVLGTGALALLRRRRRA